jgi:tetratricopeptide (TPR) repeat protein
MYLPSLGLFLLAGAGLGAVPEAKKRLAAPALALAFIILTVFSFLTVRQQAVWKDSVALWSREIENFPGFYLGYNNRGSAWAEAGRFREAIGDYSVSIRLKPAFPDAYVNRGIARWRLEEFALAQEDLIAAIRLNPNLAEAYHYLALTFMSTGNAGFAAEAEKKARELGYR